MGEIAGLGLVGGDGLLFGLLIEESINRDKVSIFFGNRLKSFEIIKHEHILRKTFIKIRLFFHVLNYKC